MAKYKKFVSVVAYMSNSENEVTGFLDKVMTKCTQIFDKCELILVNDASTDSTLDTVREYYKGKSPDHVVTIVKFASRQGMELAMNAGRDLAIGDFVFEFDDMIPDYDPEVIEQAFEASLKGYDIVSVSPNSRARLSSRLFYKIYNRFSGTQHPIGNEAFRLLSRRAVNRVKSMGTHIPYRKAVYMNCGLNVTGIKYESLFGNGGKTRHSLKKKRTDLAIDSFIYFTNVMEKISLVISSAFFIFGIGVVAYVIQSFFADEHLESGWVSVMGFLSIGFFGLFALLTIVMKYLSVIVNLVFKQQHYLIEDLEKISGN